MISFTKAFLPQQWSSYDVRQRTGPAELAVRRSHTDPQFSTPWGRAGKSSGSESSRPPLFNQPCATKGGGRGGGGGVMGGRHSSHSGRKIKGKKEERKGELG